MVWKHPAPAPLAPFECWPYTMVIPKFYWDAESPEQRVKYLCMLYDKLMAYVNGLRDDIYDEGGLYDIVLQLQKELPELVKEDVQTIVDDLVNNGQFADMIKEAIKKLTEELQSEIQTGLADEATNRVNADNALQAQVDVLKASRKYVNVVTELGVDNTGAEDCAAKLNAAFENGGFFYFPPGEYRINSQLLIYDNLHVVGCGEKSVIKADSSMDAVYHTVCTANANDINARLARNAAADGYPAVDDVCPFYVHDFSIERITIDGNWQFRNLKCWNKYYGTVQREPGTNIELQRCYNAVIRDVRSINGIQHNLNVRAGAYSYNMGATYKAAYPSYNILISGVYTLNERFDDCITTHDSYGITIENCFCEIPNNVNGTYAEAIGNGIEIDDGSHDVLVTGCTVKQSFCGFQCKNHNNTSPAYNVVFQNCTALLCHMPFSFNGNSSWTDETLTTHNVMVLGCRILHQYAFTTASSYQAISYSMMGVNVSNILVDGLLVDNSPVPEQISKDENGILYLWRGREQCYFITLKNIKILGDIESSTATLSYVNNDGASRNLVVRDCKFPKIDYGSNNYVVKYANGSIYGSCVVDGCTYIEGNSTFLSIGSGAQINDAAKNFAVRYP